LHARATLLALAIVAAVAAFAAIAGLGTAARLAPPVNTAPPTISGTPQQSQTLTTSNGTWTGAGTINFTYQWLRCNSAGNACSAIGGATNRTYTLRGADVGSTIRARVTATNADGGTSSTSAPTAVVTRSGATGCPTGTGPVSVTALSPPARLTVDGQTLAPVPVGRSTQSLTARFHVSACGGRAVQGALVYVTATPYNQFSIPPEASTGADGWAQLSMNRLRGYPATPRQRLLVMFVRARKQGEDLLGGISTRRLVSFPVNLRR
jgi:hypothetical protein